MPTFWKLASSELSSTQSTVTFSNIPQTYRDLVIVGRARTNNAANIDQLTLRVNGNSGAIYSIILGYAQSSGSLGGLTNYNSTYARTGYYVTGANAGSDYAAAFQLYIPNYTNTSYAKFALWHGASSANGTASNTFGNGFSGTRIGTTSAITSIELSALIQPTSFVTNSTFYLYGI